MLDVESQTLKNSSDIMSLVSTVGQLANTVERHERMMAAGFDKLEHAMASGITDLQARMTGEDVMRESKRVPWWQLVLTIVSVLSISGGSLIAFVLFLNGALESKINALSTESSRVAVVISDNNANIRALTQVVNERRYEFDHIHAEQDQAQTREWDIIKLQIHNQK